MKKYALLFVAHRFVSDIVDGNKLFSQGLKLNKYRPGEGITWSNARDAHLSRCKAIFNP
jgi:hypothetical protein